MNEKPRNSLNDVGPKIVFYRKRMQMKQKDLAEQAGITARYLCSIENKKCIPSITVLCNIADVLEISVSKLMEEED